MDRYRHGAFCAHPLMHDLLGTATGAVAARASVGLGTTTEDVDRFLGALACIAADGPAWTYRRHDTQWLPDPDPRRRPAIRGLLQAA